MKADARAASGVTERFVARSGVAIDLVPGYRDSIQGKWPLFFWPTRVLHDAVGRFDLPPALEAIWAGIRTIGTLPAPLREIAGEVRAFAEARRDVYVFSDTRDAALDVPYFWRPLTGDEAEGKVAEQCALARQFLQALPRAVRPARHILEVGCGRGYLAMALALRTGAEVVGIDIGDLGHFGVAEKPAVQEAFEARDANLPRRVHLTRGDVQVMPEIPAGSQDLIVSYSVLEHVRDMRAAFAEMFRVLRPGGHAVHCYDPWFSPKGAHSLCTLDSPWAHLLLDEEDVEDFLLRRRPHEADAAMGFYRGGFQVPRLHLDEMKRGAEAAGFACLTWDPQEAAFSSHEAWLTPRLHAQIMERHPALGRRDLFTTPCWMVLRKPT